MNVKKLEHIAYGVMVFYILWISFVTVLSVITLISKCESNKSNEVIIIQQPYLEYTTGHADTLCYGRVDTLDVLKGH